MIRKLGIQLDRDGDHPLYLQIAQAIQMAARTGRLLPGAKLPSSRDVARELGVHRRTVVQAFRYLAVEGWVNAGVGQGTFIREQLPLAAHANPTSLGATLAHQIDPPDRGRPNGGGAFPWDGILRQRGEADPGFWRFWSESRPAADWIRFTGATADPALFPIEDFRQVVDEVFRTQGPRVLDYGPIEGYPPLREWLAERLQARGVRAEPDQILIVNGSQQGLDLITRVLISEGDSVLVEEPGYSSGFRLFQSYGARTVSVPLDEGGLRVDLLEQFASQTAPRLLYLMPIFQNPTGLTLDEKRVEPLLEICARYGIPVVEDQFDADLVYEGAPPSPIKARDRRDQVILLGSFSKILFPGLRLGWLVVPKPLLRTVKENKQLADFSTGLFVQCAMDLYCRRGLLDQHVERVRGIYGQRLQVMLEAMQQEFPSSVTWTRPRGGLTLWVRLPDEMDSLDLLERSRREGVDFSPGPLFYPNGGGASRLRLSYVRESEERIRRGVKLLGSLLHADGISSREMSVSRPFI